MFNIATIEPAPGNWPRAFSFAISRDIATPNNTLPSAPIKATAANRIGDTPTPTLHNEQAPGEDIRKAEPEVLLPRHRAPTSSDCKPIQILIGDSTHRLAEGGFLQRVALSRAAPGIIQGNN
jgi:hypothetical protein